MPGNMDVLRETFEMIGATAGLLSFLSPLFGTYQDRTIRKVLDDQNKTIKESINRLDESISRLPRRERNS